MNGNIGLTPKVSAKIISENWICYFLSSDNGTFISSDNPTLTLNVKGSAPGIIYLPLHPNLAVIALKKNIISLSYSKISKKDMEYLNSYMISNCNREVYFDKQFTKEDISYFRKLINRRPERKN
jgi:hypothetical protein